MVSFASRPGSIYPKTVSATSPIPDELIRLDQWVCWRYNRDKSKKPPVDPLTGRSIDWTDPGKWLPFEAAYAAAQEHGYGGVGFVPTPGDPYSFVDLDNVIDPETGRVEPWAGGIVEEMDSYTEVSPSGRGLRIAVRGKLPFSKRGTPPVEIFSQGGYVTITGNVFAGSAGPIVEAQNALENLHRKHCQPEITTTAPSTMAPLPDPIDLTDDELLEKARNADKLGWKFAALYDSGDLSHSKNDASAADNDLMMQLAFWTGKDPDRMERMFGRSALGERDKWRTRPNYRRRTINNATKKTRAVYEPEKHRPDKTRTRDRLKGMVAYAVLQHPWKERAGRSDAGATDFFGYLGSLRLAHKANTLEPDVSIRNYMEAAGISDFTTALNSLSRLENTHGLLVKVRDGGNGNAARYRLRDVPKPKHIEIRGNTFTQTPPRAYNVCAGLLAPLAGAYLIRNASPEMPEYDKNGRKIPRGPAPMVKSVGKAAAMVAYVFATVAPIFEDGVVPASFVSERTGISLVNLKRRHIPKLVAAGLVEEAEGGYAPPEDVREALKAELRVSGSLAAANHQRQRHDRQRRAQEIKRLAWLGHNAEAIAAEMGCDPDEIAALLTPPDEAPTEAEMDATRLAKGADGEVAELEREAEHFPEVFTPDADPQHPIGYDYPEASENPVSVSEPVQRVMMLPDHPESAEGSTEAPTEKPCKHSGLGYVFPGGSGCYICDPDHPLRRYERENIVVSLDEYRRQRVA